MRQIRSNVFETNSSSCHSIAIDSSGLEPSNLEVDTDGAIYIAYGKFGSNYEVFNTQYDKLSYLISLCYFLTDGSIYDSYAFEHVEEAICEYTGAQRIRLEDEYDYPDIDHQMQPTGMSDCIVDLWDNKAIVNFVFNKYISLVTDRD